MHCTWVGFRYLKEHWYLFYERKRFSDNNKSVSPLANIQLRNRRVMITPPHLNRLRKLIHMYVLYLESTRGDRP